MIIQHFIESQMYMAHYTNVYTYILRRIGFHTPYFYFYSTFCPFQFDQKYLVEITKYLNKIDFFYLTYNVIFTYQKF